ncbi:uncharacterized protein LOC141914993 [Tubulanus polymorphus]|uniref:uncharacterized protein LOC141914993 n=1 Tax=Tubulanus polymorphus TaxID=672921 RepID=UPI003DA2EED2
MMSSGFEEHLDPLGTSSSRSASPRPVYSPLPIPDFGAPPLVTSTGDDSIENSSPIPNAATNPFATDSITDSFGTSPQAAVQTNVATENLFSLSETERSISPVPTAGLIPPTSSPIPPAMSTSADQVKQQDIFSNLDVLAGLDQPVSPGPTATPAQTGLVDLFSTGNTATGNNVSNSGSGNAAMMGGPMMGMAPIPPVSSSMPMMSGSPGMGSPAMFGSPGMGSPAMGNVMVGSPAMSSPAMPRLRTAPQEPKKGWSESCYSIDIDPSLVSSCYEPLRLICYVSPVFS